MSTNAAGEGHHKVEGVEERDAGDPDVRDPDTHDHPEDGPAMTGAGAQPGGSSMDHWKTASPSTDATKPETMPHTPSTPMPGETEDRTPV